MKNLTTHFIFLLKEEVEVPDSDTPTSCMMNWGMTNAYA